MKKMFLLPAWAKWAGLALSLAGLAVYFLHPEVTETSIFGSGGGFFPGSKGGGFEGWYNEIGMTLWLFGQLGLALSRLKLEDEMTIELRMRAFYLSALVNTIVAIIITWTTYDSFLGSVMYAYFFYLLVYNLIYYALYFKHVKTNAE